MYNKIMNKGFLLLTSTGLTSPNIYEKFRGLVSDPKKQSVAIITTAAEGKENNKYSQLAKKQFESLGFVNVDFVDLETQPEKDFSPYGIIYVCGGNTFKLLKFAKKANFKLSIKKLLERNGIYIGVSAGSIIVGPSINIANEVEPDPNDVGLEDLTGFDITSLIVLPHYSPEMETETDNFEKKYRLIVERLDNSRAILIDNGEKTFIE
ncbi:Type 1 glutamine amidotransferase-like domain-containing protein [Candidatus Uhrbacteria bacterium]|nr:Type 1 glutamine amidotransferase-like domain-containing protein [Candidatus Uhrbacteria bacterium]